MEQTTLTIGGKEYPVRYPMAAITRIMRELQMNTVKLSNFIQSTLDAMKDGDPETLSDKYMDMLRLITVTAWAGIYSGEKHAGKPVTFQTVDELAEAVESIDEINNSLNWFLSAYVKFTGADRVSEDVPGEVLPLTEQTLPA